MNRRSFTKGLTVSTGIAFLAPNWLSKALIPPEQAQPSPKRTPWTTVKRPIADIKLDSSEDVVMVDRDITLTLPPAQGGQPFYIIPERGATVTVDGLQLTKPTMFASNGSQWIPVKTANTFKRG